MFKPRFAPLVESGAKLQTVRPTPKRMPKVGDPISLREWTGRPYHSKQRILFNSVITKVQSFWFNGVTILIDDPKGEKGLMSREAENAFARADGFADLADMAKWFEETHGWPFTGIVIHWKPPATQGIAEKPIRP